MIFAFTIDHLFDHRFETASPPARDGEDRRAVFPHIAGGVVGGPHGISRQNHPECEISTVRAVVAETEVGRVHIGYRPAFETLFVDALRTSDKIIRSENQSGGL